MSTQIFRTDYVGFSSCVQSLRRSWINVGTFCRHGGGVALNREGDRDSVDVDVDDEHVDSCSNCPVRSIVRR